jgi:hypothetical protein
MLVKVSKIEANPFRRLDHYKIIQEKVDELKNSINETTFWGGLLARENPSKKGFYQLAFGHHRIEAIRQLEIKEIDIQIRDIDDSLLLRMMANENLDTWKTTPAVINETVWATRDFLIKEFNKYSKYEDLPEILNLLLEKKEDGSMRNDREKRIAFKQTKNKIGAPTIKEFLGGNWSQSTISIAISTIDDKEVDREAVEEFQTIGQADVFKRAVKTYEVPKYKQKELAKEIIKDGKDSVRGVKEAVKEKAVESKKSKALTVQDKKKIEEDLEVKELEELCKEVSKSMNKTTADISDLIKKIKEMNIDSFSGLSVLGFKNNFDSLIKAVTRFAPYFNISITKENIENEE